MKVTHLLMSTEHQYSQVVSSCLTPTRTVNDNEVLDVHDHVKDKMVVRYYWTCVDLLDTSRHDVISLTFSFFLILLGSQL